LGNPFEAPASDLAQPGEIIRPPARWRIYALSLLALFALSVAVIVAVYGVAWMSALDVLHNFVSAIGFVGLFGYAFWKPIASSRAWRVWAVIQPLWDFLYSFVFDSLGWSGQLPDTEPETRVEFFATRLIGLAVAAPLYLALFRYGYRSRKLWREPSASS